MKINFDTKILDMEGKELIDAKKKPLTLATTAIDCLLAAKQGASQKQKLEQYCLAKKLKNRNKNGIVTITLKEAEMVMQAIGSMDILGPLIVGRCQDIIDGA